jgi:hypothetical protein
MPLIVCGLRPLRPFYWHVSGNVTTRRFRKRHWSAHGPLAINLGINVEDILPRWLPHVVGARSSIVVALDWTDFDADNQATSMLSLLTDYGRATPLVWLTVDKRTLKDNRSLYGIACWSG